MTGGGQDKAPPPTRRQGTLFLEKGSYRQRRLADAARLLPVLGAVLLAIPLLWPEGEAEGAPATSTAIIYVFGVWFLLVGAAVLLARWIDPGATPGPDRREDEV
ncbi:hypothetical protein ACRARG_04880 [Pseudooceanicola sp. C21-150M6]|uniref:hypothetical protein n=1 Tax=Pseudooceanicola sp. C21-150M6 TaxID=3434355 RepID=UPI003D7F7294